MKPTSQPSIRIGPERVLELVAVAPGLHGRQDWLELEAAEPPDALECIADLLLLYLQLALVGDHLPGRPRMVRLGSDPLRARLHHLNRAGLRISTLGLLDHRPHTISRHGSGHEHHVPVQARHAGPAKGQRVDGQLKLIARLGYESAFSIALSTDLRLAWRRS